ncbi:putative organic cation transporter protein-like [Apostichopus japonicus]|uniref:Putative organic cation transporter protein-like n=1 Tax=Stichopus japonicus TaxID=307972 RepID=A0A2G8JIA5_STIJA|nr:putative organic cation transporter protein-like [Apostichopus japonicus]
MNNLFNVPHLVQEPSNTYKHRCVQSLVYYGLSLSTSELGVDPFLSFMISGVVEIPAYLCCMFVADVLDAGVWRLIVVMAGKFGITMSFSLVYTWAVELVPTSLRSIGLGVFSLTSRIGSVIAPLILLLEDVWIGLPYFIFGGAATLAGLLCLLLPETKGKPLPTTIQDTEQLARKLEKLREPPSLFGIENPSWKANTSMDNEGEEEETLGETSEDRI